MDNKILAEYQRWLTLTRDENLLAELKAMNEKQIENAFYKDLSFGTAGLRGVIGAGTNCLNIYTIRKLTQGYSNYLIKSNSKSVAISYDSRINSKIFAREAAMVFADNGFNVFITSEIQPTPFLSYAIRNLKCDGGVMITASHNPCEYNGFKVYDNSGCQVNDKTAEMIADEIATADAFYDYEKDFNFYFKIGKIKYIETNVLHSYINEIKELQQNKIENIKITYTALNGAGYKLVPSIFKEITDCEMIPVSEQCYPDGNFLTCKYPNPEKTAALELGLTYVNENKSDFLLATDPDADRMSVAVLHGNEYYHLSGNEIGILMLDYILKLRKEKGTLPLKPIVIKTIVTTPFIETLVKEYNGECINVLTGFKNIGEAMNRLEIEDKLGSFVFAFEEAIGFLPGTHCREKDGIAASVIISEAVSYYKKQGKTLLRRLAELYSHYGYCQNILESFTFTGIEGAQKIENLMELFRTNKITKIGDVKVKGRIDYLFDKTNLPKSNVLEFNFEGGGKLIIRPSGTEPIIKFYLTLCESRKKNLETHQKIMAWLKVKMK